MTNELPKAYDPHEIEGRVYKTWEEKKYFHAKPEPSKKPYCIVIPPPNITGILHMGHALNNTIQDILVRYKRMNGFETLWMPGTDHAGIATQNVVEKKLRKDGRHKDQLGRDKFIEEVWKWREEYGSTIISQLKSLGSSCDWDRTRFTMDDGLSNAVNEVFVRLYQKGLIYRGEYIINWCPRCKTALSDEESEHKDVDGALYHIKYPVNVKSSKSKGKAKDEAHDFVIIATTRPETMLGDVAICINPKDKRYKHLHDAEVTLPIVGRKLRVILDPKVDMKFGTGVLKVTPAHDPVDFMLGMEHKLENVNVMNDDATINDLGGEFKGLDRFKAREAVIEKLKELGLFEKIEPHKHAVGHCYRCHTVVEPRLSKQWFVKMAPLAKPALEAVKTGRIKFYPKRWTKVYINWMENIRDWCISRQIWWGHRLPVYYCEDCLSDAKIQNSKVKGQNDNKGIIVSKTRPEKCPDCGGTNIVQDPDVLDTWFSSWLWPFSTLGWPEKTDDLKYFYPTNTLVTAQEIIFFWVARMIMAGIEFMDEIPFKDVYIHGTVRDDTGTKMSKSLGNTIDPLEIIEKFGADALRFSIISITAQGQDVYLSPQKFEIGRNFANKLWNASRFVLMNLKDDVASKSLCQSADDPTLSLADKWILSRFYAMLSDFSKALESYKMNEAANRIYDFLWHEYCDWYLELAKLSIEEPHTQMTLYKVLEKSLRVLHPIMPFITEDIWQKLPKEHGTESIMISPWPHMQKKFISKKIDREMELVIKVIQTIRNLRSSWRIEPAKFLNVSIKVSDKAEEKILAVNTAYLKKLARIENIEISGNVTKPAQSAVSVIGNIEVFLDLSGLIDIEKEKARLEAKIAELTAVVENINKKLSNENFVARAPKDIIEKEKERKAYFESEIAGLAGNLNSL